jgi:hypothetical protein
MGSMPMPTARRAALLGLVTILSVAAAAHAQVQPPPLSQDAPPPAAGAPPSAGAPPADAPPAVTPLAPTLAPEPTQAPPLQLTERTAPEQQQPRPEPLYQKTWFWAAVGVVFVTATLILFVTLRDKANEPPTTTLGNMNVF